MNIFKSSDSYASAALKGPPQASTASAALLAIGSLRRSLASRGPSAALLAALLALSACWPAGILFHAAFGGSFESWAQNPLMLHAGPLLWDPHAGFPGWAAPGGLHGASGLFHVLLTVAPYCFGSRSCWAASLGWQAVGLLHASTCWAQRDLASARELRPHHLPVAALTAAAALAAGAEVQELSAVGGLDPFACSLGRGDIIHQHMAIGVVLASVAPSLSQFAYSHALRSAALSALSVAALLSGLLAQHSLAMPAFMFIRFDAQASAFLFGHHTWTCGLLTLAAFSAFSHAFGEAFIMNGAKCSHLSWTSLWLGFHAFGLLMHNDSQAAFSAPWAHLAWRPPAAELVQLASLSACPGARCFFRVLGSGDFFAHHSIAVGVHASALILLKGAAAAAASRLMPDKAAHGFGFACDGPGRGGSCDISAWDSVYLAAFWALNTGAWLLFHMHWASMNPAAFTSAAAGALLGWFRDYLWASSASIVRGHGLRSDSPCAPLSWAFLLAHLAWATGFMFLISWRGYWHEVIEVLAAAHLCAPVLREAWQPFGQARLSPAALSIVQARAVGSAHFGVGFIGTYFCFMGSAS